MAFIGLNPSTADETRNDPTVRRCLGFARSWGFARLQVLNLYAYRSPDPAALRRVEDPVGAESDRVIAVVSRGCGLVVAAWGARAEQSRIDVVIELVPDLHCLGVTKGGFPRHPLYVRGDTVPVRLRDAADASSSPRSPESARGGLW